MASVDVSTIPLPDSEPMGPSIDGMSLDRYDALDWSEEPMDPVVEAGIGDGIAGAVTATVPTETGLTHVSEPGGEESTENRGLTRVHSTEFGKMTREELQERYEILELECQAAVTLVQTTKGEKIQAEERARALSAEVVKLQRCVERLQRVQHSFDGLVKAEQERDGLRALLVVRDDEARALGQNTVKGLMDMEEKCSKLRPRAGAGRGGTGRAQQGTTSQGDREDDLVERLAAMRGRVGQLCEELDWLKEEVTRIKWTRGKAEAAVPQHGYPLDIATWESMHELQLVGPHYAYAHRLCCLAVFLTPVPAEKRTALEQHAVTEYRSSDWYTDVGTMVHATNSENIKAVAGFSQGSILNKDRYDVNTFAMVIQYRNQRVRGCDSIDDCQTVDLRLARGAHLFQMASLRRQHGVEDSELLSIPGLYTTLLAEYKLVPATRLNPTYWSAITGATTVERWAVVTRLAAWGVTPPMIDDSYAFGQQWLQESMISVGKLPMWTTERAEEIMMMSATMPPAPRMYDAAQDVLLRRYKRTCERIVAFSMPEPNHPDAHHLKRQENSRIERLLAEGRYPSVPPNVIRIAVHNPGQAQIDTAEADALRNVI
ncbi:hypothetical protein C8R43DRAFT_944852 [Mycena crocata]|nr:hypothetical protein C8R43DRAFT_944852 [Mycena crocata]